MIFYNYDLEWKDKDSLLGVPSEELEGRTHRSFGGRVESLNTIYNDSRIYNMNDEFYSSYLKHERFAIFVHRRIDTEISVAVASSIDAVKSAEWEDIIHETFPECIVIRKKEITAEEFRNSLTLNNFGNGSRVLDRLNIKIRRGMFDPFPFKLMENVNEYAKLTKAECRRRAKKILGSKSLYEEINRIYSKENQKGYKGHPVHYLISAGDWNAAMDIYSLLIAALYSNGRLLSTRETVLRDIQKGAYRDERYKVALDSAEGGIAVIELKTEDDLGRFATDFHEFTKFTGCVLEQNKKDTLFIFVEIMGKAFKSSEAIDNIVSKADIIQITEGSGTFKEAKEYLLELTEKAEFEIEDVEDVAKFLPEAEFFTVTDIFNAYNAWYGSGLKNHVYKAYKDKKTFRVEVTKVENKPYEELQSMIGLTDAKRVVDEIIDAAKVMKVRERMGINTEGNTLHMLFSGNPGTAKTSVARLLAKILKDEEVLKSGSFVECGRQDLVGKYVGWTAKIVEEKFRAAKGGVLFIDEAYSLVDDSNTYGAEAINTITQLMENYRQEVIVIFAGYTEKMIDFLENNEGLKSRIAFHLDFPDYTPAELIDILKLMSKKRDYILSDDAIPVCKDIFERATEEENYGNGRYVRNVLEQAILRQSRRIIAESLEREKSGQKDLSKEEICTLTKADFKFVPQTKRQREVKMGFAV